MGSRAGRGRAGRASRPSWEVCWAGRLPKQASCYKAARSSGSVEGGGADPVTDPVTDPVGDPVRRSSQAPSARSGKRRTVSHGPSASNGNLQKYGLTEKGAPGWPHGGVEGVGERRRDWKVTASPRRVRGLSHPGKEPPRAGANAGPNGYASR